MPIQNSTCSKLFGTFICGSNFFRKVSGRIVSTKIWISTFVHTLTHTSTKENVPMKSMMSRPFEKRPVGWWKKVSPYGRNATWGRLLGSERPSKFPVSAIESPKLIIDLKLWHCGSEITIVSKTVDRIRKKLRSFMIREAMRGQRLIGNFSK